MDLHLRQVRPETDHGYEAEIRGRQMTVFNALSLLAATVEAFVPADPDSAVVRPNEAQARHISRLASDGAVHAERDQLSRVDQIRQDVNLVYDEMTANSTVPTPVNYTVSSPNRFPWTTGGQS